MRISDGFDFESKSLIKIKSTLKTICFSKSKSNQNKNFQLKKSVTTLNFGTYLLNYPKEAKTCLYSKPKI